MRTGGPLLFGCRSCCQSNTFLWCGGLLVSKDTVALCISEGTSSLPLTQVTTTRTIGENVPDCPVFHSLPLVSEQHGLLVDMPDCSCLLLLSWCFTSTETIRFIRDFFSGCLYSCFCFSGYWLIHRIVPFVELSLDLRYTGLSGYYTIICQYIYIYITYLNNMGF